MRDDDAAARTADLVRAGRALARHGLVTAFGHVSVRHHGSLLITAPVPLGTLRPVDVRRLEVEGDALPPGTPHEAWMHHGVAAVRP